MPNRSQETVNRSAPVTVAALYQFTRFGDPASIIAPLQDVSQTHAVKGTLLVAREGINGTIAGSFKGVTAVIDHVRTLPGCAAIEYKTSFAVTMPFHRMKVRLKEEIVTLGAGDVDPARNAGVYVEPEDWNALISDSATVVIDTRNDYEVSIGTFAGAIDPRTTSFREFPAWFKRHKDTFKGKKLAMFCTGGIRCEKATAYAKAAAANEIYHLKGGILKYLELIPRDESLWQGECFVFDERVSIGHGLEPGDHVLCRACRKPLSPADLASPHYEEGVSCAYCREQRTEEDRRRYRERHKQVKLAEIQGRKHIGQD